MHRVATKGESRWAHLTAGLHAQKCEAKADDSEQECTLVPKVHNVGSGRTAWAGKTHLFVLPANHLYWKIPRQRNITRMNDYTL